MAEILKITEILKLNLVTIKLVLFHRTVLCHKNVKTKSREMDFSLFSQGSAGPLSWEKAFRAFRNGFSIHFETLTPLAGNIAFDIWVKLKDTNYILIYDLVIDVF